VASPFDASAGTWSGDVKLNSTNTFNTSGSVGYDLYTVLLHEAGHVFGLDDSTDTSSAMYENYQGPRTGLGAGDVARLQALYGARTPDSLEGAGGNDTFGTASPLLLPGLTSSSLAAQADADVTTLQDKDYYRFTTLAAPGGLSVQVQTAGLSLLAPRVTVYDAAHNVVASAVSVNPLDGGVAVSLARVLPLSTYYVKVESGTGDIFGVGSYHLSIASLPNGTLPTGTLLGAVQTGATGLLNN